ncbi:MAG TPA: metallophosphoesterase [Bacteroidales bacterium]
MKIQYASDLHLEFPENKEFFKRNPLLPGGDVLLLAGDIVPFAVMDKHDDFFNYVSDTFETTYWIPGNHEYYYSDISEKSGSLNETIRSNVFLVNNCSVKHESVNLIFSTLWSEISPANHWQIEQGISDFHVIKYNGNRFSSEQFNQLNHESISFLREVLHHTCTGKRIVISHHVPTFLNYPRKFKMDKLSEAFVVELSDLIEDSGPGYWIYGHSHHNTKDFSVGETQLLTNQLGYIRNNEQIGYHNGKIIDMFK